ncbi:hypothetical protein QE152_g25755 [Popillia japonica]|uniref:Uncharacterized protein n=1 Tax=Popillia japonica TaxID=7064 RepID=A0AAW1K0I3_POPJA
MAKRLRRYRESHLRKHQNTEFATNQKNFYKNLKKTPSDGKENDAMPKKEELLQFWTGIWKTERRMMRCPRKKSSFNSGPVYGTRPPTTE